MENLHERAGFTTDNSNLDQIEDIQFEQCINKDALTPEQFGVMDEKPTDKPNIQGDVTEEDIEELLDVTKNINRKNVTQFIANELVDVAQQQPQNHLNTTDVTLSKSSSIVKKKPKDHNKSGSQDIQEESTDDNGNLLDINDETVGDNIYEMEK